MKIRNVIMCGLMTAVTAVLSQIAIPLPFSPVPVSLGILGVFLCGGLLRPGAAALSQLAYLLLGVIGVPVFSSFGSGIGKLLGPTGGFLFSYPLMAVMVSLAVKIGFTRTGYFPRVLFFTAGMVLATLICYACGTAWFCYSQQVDVAAALGMCVVPFLLPDALKVVLTSAILPVLRARLDKAGTSI